MLVKKYCVYVHRRKDNNKPFYIGCCSRDDNTRNLGIKKYRRAFDFGQRRPRWFEIRDESGGVNVEIFFTTDDREEAFKKEMLHSRKRNRDYSVFKHQLADGKVRDVEVRTTPIKMDEDHVLHSVIIHDITDRIRAENEKKRLESQLRRAHKMEAIGTLAGGIAHNHGWRSCAVHWCRV